MLTYKVEKIERTPYGKGEEIAGEEILDRKQDRIRIVTTLISKHDDRDEAIQAMQANYSGDDFDRSEFSEVTTGETSFLFKSKSDSLHIIMWAITGLLSVPSAIIDSLDEETDE